MADHGATREQIASVAVKNHAHSTANPYAQYQEPIALERRADGTTDRRAARAARLLADQRRRRRGRRGQPRTACAGSASAARRVSPGADSSAARCQAGLPDVNEEDVSRRAGQEAYRLAGIEPGDIDFVEMHDCFTIAEIVRLEGLGLLPKGDGARLTDERPHKPRRRAAGEPERRPALARSSRRRDRRGAGLRAVLAAHRPGGRPAGRQRQASGSPTARAARSAAPTARRSRPW